MIKIKALRPRVVKNFTSQNKMGLSDCYWTRLFISSSEPQRAWYSNKVLSTDS